MPKKQLKNESVSNGLFWVLVGVTFLAVVAIWFVFFKRNIVQIKSVPGSDFATFRKEVDDTFKKLGDSFKDVPNLTNKKKSPAEAFKQNVLAELEKKSAAAAGPEATSTGQPATWEEFKSNYGFSLQHPADWQAEEKKVGEWFNFSLTQKDVDDGLLISDLPVDFSSKFQSESQVTIDGQKYQKVILDVPTKSALILIDEGKYKGYYIIYPTVNLENTQLFESIMETIKFSR